MIGSSSLRISISQELQRGVHFLFQGLPQGEDIALWHKWLGDVFQVVYRRQIPAAQIWGVQEMPWDIQADTDTAIIHFGPNEISNMKKSIQEEIEALRAETAAANAATAAYNREKETYRRQADETAVELAKMRAELMRAEREKAELLLKYNALKNKSRH